MSYKIVIDSCGELTDAMKSDTHFQSAALTMYVDEYAIVDDETFDQADFLKKVAASPNCPKSACPSPEAYKNAFDCGVERAYAVTLSANLSGSYNSAVLGKNLLQEEKPQIKIHVFNSCSASIAQTLIGMKIQECENAGMSFEEVVETVEAYIDSQNTWFVLESLETLRKNGRLSTMKAFIATALNIRPVCVATPEGTIEQHSNARGINRAMVRMVDSIVEKAVNTEEKVLAISHVNCPERAQMVKEAIAKKLNLKDIIILDTAGISSMYAGDGGIIVVV